MTWIGTTVEMRLALIAVGRLRSGPLKELERHYAERLAWPLAPLGALSLYTDMLKEGTLGKDEILHMESSISKMSDLIDDTMDFTRGRLGGGIALEAMTDAPLGPVLALHVVPCAASQTSCAVPEPSGRQ